MARLTGSQTWTLRPTIVERAPPTSPPTWLVSWAPGGPRRVVRRPRGRSTPAQPHRTRSSSPPRSFSLRSSTQEADDARTSARLARSSAGHGFDDQGSRYDGRKPLELVDDEDRVRKNARRPSVEQYDSPHNPAGAGRGVRGGRRDARSPTSTALTIGENIGDLGG